MSPKVYIVSSVGDGAYIDSGYSADNLKLYTVNWIAVFSTKEAARAYVAFLHQNYSHSEIHEMVR